ncbi:MAG: hypothetical protein FJW23_13335 [Acidimicrobiia bacterium]|nr:hypothetical protein [Acidimicrobiia bacterium]
MVPLLQKRQHPAARIGKRRAVQIGASELYGSAAAAVNRREDARGREKSRPRQTRIVACLPIGNRRSPITNHQSPIVNAIPNHKSSITNLACQYRLPVL